MLSKVICILLIILIIIFYFVYKKLKQNEYYYFTNGTYLKENDVAIGKTYPIHSKKDDKGE